MCARSRQVLVIRPIDRDLHWYKSSHNRYYSLFFFLRSLLPTLGQRAVHSQLPLGLDHSIASELHAAPKVVKRYGDGTLSYSQRGCSSESGFYCQNTHEIGPAAKLPCKLAQPPKPVLNNGGQCSAAWPRNVLQPSVYCCGRCSPYVTKTIISVSLSGPPSVSTSPCYPLRAGDNFRGHRLRNGGPGLVSLLAASSRVRISAKVFFLLAFVSGSRKR